MLQFQHSTGLVFWGVAAAVCISLCPSPLWADGRDILLEAYDATKTASTIEACTKIIDACTPVKPSELSAKMSGYRGKLLAWAHNRRGELYSRRAATSGASFTEAPSTDELDGLAFDDFDTALRYDQEHWKVWHNRGIGHAVQGRHQAAIEDFTEALARNPQDTDTRFNRASVLTDLGRHPDALEDLDQLLRENPDDLDARVARARVRRILGQHAAALSDCERALHLNVDSVTALIQRGKTFEAVSEWEKAAADFRRAVELDRRSADANLAAAWLMATCPQERFRNPSLAVRTASRGAELVSKWEVWKADDVAAAAHAALGSFEAAEKHATRALAKAPPVARAAVQERLRSYQSKKPFRQFTGATMRGQLGEPAGGVVE